LRHTILLIYFEFFFLKFARGFELISWLVDSSRLTRGFE